MTKEFSAKAPDGISLNGWAIGDGEGPLVIGLHGGLGLDASYLLPALDGFPSTVRVVAYDQRGHGRSGGRDSLPAASLSTFARDLEAVRESVDAERFVLFGHSYGGFIALEYAIRYPERLAGLILCATSASLSHFSGALERVGQFGRPDELSALHELLTTPPESDQVFGDKWCAITPLYFRDHAISHRQAFERSHFSAAGYAAGARCLAEYDVVGKLNRIHAPTLLLHGAHDWLMPSATAGAELAQGLQQASHITFGESGHYPFIEEPTVWSSAVSGWIRRLEL